MSDKHLPGSTEFERPDGSVWRVFMTDGGSQVVLTRTCINTIRNKTETILHTDGKEVVSTIGKDLLKAVRQYRKGGDDTRRHIHSGGNGSVFQVGDTDFVVKECFTSQSLLSSMERMDGILELIESGGVPRWIQLPVHYGYASVPDENGGKKQYLLMDKIDEGVTVEDVLNGPRNDKIAQQISSSGLNNFAQEIRERYLSMVEILQKVCADGGLIFEDIFTDLHEGNVLVEIANPPVGGSHVLFNIIDQ